MSIEIDKSLRDTPNPGSDEAIALGCTCPVMDNGRGRGAWGSSGLFWMARSCPVHGDEARHYAMMYGQDGPVTIYEVTRKEVSL